MEGVLAPARRGVAVSYRPPKWDERGRSGAIEVPAGASLVVLEGVGAGRRELTGLLDGVVWAQTDRDEAARRDDRSKVKALTSDSQGRSGRRRAELSGPTLRIAGTSQGCRYLVWPALSTTATASTAVVLLIPPALRPSFGSTWTLRSPR